MNKVQAKDRVAKLKDLINDYRFHYHVLDESIMDDAAADSLKHELAQLESEFPDLVTADSPTQRVAGGVLPGFKKVEHKRRMLSLSDVFGDEEVAAWISRMQKSAPGDRLAYFADIKMDGLACALIYEDGLLIRGVTRGDGFVGEDVTANIRTIDSIPLALRQQTKYPLLLKGVSEIRGEIVMYKRDFEQLNIERQKQGQPPFANPRNTAAGTIRQLDPNLVADRPLHFRAYDLLRLKTEDVPTNDYVYKALPDLGFSVNKAATVLHSLEEIMEFVRLWQDNRKELEFNTDGIVIKINDRRLFDQLGVAGKAPRAAIAFKYAAEQSTTKVKDIFVSIGRTGNATPVAVLEPVLIAGSVVQMATLHNESEVQRKDIRIGDTVIVHKAGDIIPEIVQSLPSLRKGKERLFKMPAYCPVCGTKLVKQKAEDAAWRCPNPSCPSRTWKQIQHFASKEALDIEGLGEKTVIALLDAGLIKDTADIYKLTPDMLVRLERFAGISANKLYSAIQAKKHPPINRFIYGLGIRHIGVQTAIDLTKKFKSLESLINAKIDELASVEGIGEIVAEAIVEYFSEPRNQHLLAKFKSLGVGPEPAKMTGGELEGKNLVVTGTLNSMNREDAADKIRALGGRFQTSVAKDTDYLVIGNAPGTGKITKARQLGTQIIDESTLLSLLD